MKDLVDRLLEAVKFSRANYPETGAIDEDLVDEAITEIISLRGVLRKTQLQTSKALKGKSVYKLGDGA